MQPFHLFWIKALPPCFTSTQRGNQEIGNTEDANSDKLIFTHFQKKYAKIATAAFQIILCGFFFQKGGETPPKSARLFSCSCHQRTYFVRREEPGTLENLLNSEDGYPDGYHKRRQGSIWSWFPLHTTSLFCLHVCVQFSKCHRVYLSSFV